MPQPFSHERFAECAQQIAEVGRLLSVRGWTPATSSNFSMRLDAEHLVVTASGRDKGRLTAADVLIVDLAGKPVQSGQRPSAETTLHVQLYRQVPDVGAVLHTHSLTQTVASRYFAPAGRVRLAGYELLKAFRGIDTHESDLCLPVFPNTQDMELLAGAVDRWLAGGEAIPGYLIEGHGVYSWGRDMAEACRHLDALEFLLACELELARMAR